MLSQKVPEDYLLREKGAWGDWLRTELLRDAIIYTDFILYNHARSRPRSSARSRLAAAILPAAKRRPLIGRCAVHRPMGGELAVARATACESGSAACAEF